MSSSPLNALGTAHCSVDRCMRLYAAVVLDAFSRQVLGLSIADHL
jgi:hypothetical protein